MKKNNKPAKQHFELSPANAKRMDSYIERFNEDPARVSPRIKIGDVVNCALDEWLSGRSGFPGTAQGSGHAEEGK
jgi:hypothetical protein